MVKKSEKNLKNIFMIFCFSAILLSAAVNGKETTLGHRKSTTVLHSILSPWIGGVGCFSGFNTSAYRSLLLTGNNVAECLFHCNTTYIGLQLNTCVCLGEKETNPDKSWNRVTACGTCDSSSSHTCGSNTTVSVYTKIHSKSPSPDDLRQRCGFVNCTQEKCQYYQGLCTNKYQGICESTTLIGSKATWNESVQICRNGGSDLFGLNGIQLSALNLSYSTNYWVNIFRTEFLPGEDIKDVHSTSSTTSVSRIVKSTASVSEIVKSATPVSETVKSTTPVNEIVKSTTHVSEMFKSTTSTSPVSETANSTTPVSVTANIYTNGCTENKTVNWNNSKTNISSTPVTKQKDNDTGMVIAIVVCFLLAVGLVIVVVLIILRRRKRLVKKRPTAIVSPTITRNSNLSVDQEHYATVSNNEHGLSDSELNMTTANEGLAVNGSEDKNPKSETLPRTYYEMKTMTELEDSECLDYMYKVPVYHTDQYVPMRNSENGEETIKKASADDTKSKGSAVPQLVQDQQLEKEMRKEIDLNTKYKNNEEIDFEPEYYPVLYIDKNNKGNGNVSLDDYDKSEKENDVDDDFKPDDYPVVVGTNKSNENSHKQAYFSNDFYTSSSKVTGRSNDAISQTSFSSRSTLSDDRGKVIQPHNESIYDYPKPRLHSAEGSSNTRSPSVKEDPQSDNKSDLFKTYDMADNGVYNEPEDSVYEPIEVNNQ